MFPKKGKFFPDRQRRPGTEVSYEGTVSEALREELRESGRTIKDVMEWTGVTERTVKNWLARKGGPKGPHLICIVRHSERVLAAVLRLADKDEQVATNIVVEARDYFTQAAGRLDAWLCKNR